MGTLLARLDASLGLVPFLRLVASRGLVASLVLSSIFASAHAAQQPDSACPRAQEFITTFEFLRSRENWGIPEADARKAAQKVAWACPGSAARFVRTTALLSEAGVTTTDAIRTGIRYAEQSDEVAGRFNSLFQQLYLEDGLDLDVGTSLRLADSLAAGLEGSLPKVEKEFAELVRLCSAGRGLDQSRAACARFATELLQVTRNQSSGVARRWEKLMDFLADADGPNLTAVDSLRLAGKILATGEEGSESFQQAYRYAISSRGLKLERVAALQFSSSLVLRDLRDPGRPEPELVPASALPLPPITTEAASRAPAQVRRKKR